MKTLWNERKLEKKKEEEILSHLQNEQPGFSIIDFFFIHPIFNVSLKSYFLCYHVASFLLFLTLHHLLSPLGSPGDGLPHGFRLRPGPHELRREVGRRGKKRDVVTQEQ